MLKPIPSNDDILDAMRAYCARKGMTMTDLCVATGNRALASKLKRGVSIQVETYNRLVETMRGRSC